MPAIPIKTPSPQEYDTFAQAIAGAEAHPLQAQARRDTETLQNLRIVGGLWDFDRAVVRFTEARELRVGIRENFVTWSITSVDQEHVPNEIPAAPVLQLDWGSTVEIRSFDPGTILREILGASFARLFVNDFGLLLYCRKCPILEFGAVTRTDTDADFLFMFLEED